MKLINYTVGTLFLTLILLTSAIAQNDKGRYAFLDSYIDGVPIKFYIYEGHIIKPTLKEFDQENLTTPEGLLWSLESCKSQEWFNKLRVFPREFSSRDIETGNPDSNNIELVNKIHISRDGSEYCIVKFYYKGNQNGSSSKYRIPACLCMQKKNEYWKFISGNGFLEPYYNLMFFVKSQYLEQIFLTGKSELNVLNNMIKNSRTDGVLNISKFYIDYQSLFNNNNDSTLIKISDKGHDQFRESNVKSIKEFSVNTRTCAELEFYQKDYRNPIKLFKGIKGELPKSNQELLKLIDKSESNNQIGLFFQNVAPNDTSVNIAITYKMELEYFGKTYALIKYKARKNNQTSYNTLVMEVIDNDYIPTKLPKDLNVWYEAVNLLKPDYISSINSASYNPKNYFEYLPIKEKSIDEMGRLNITLLVNTLYDIEKTNPKLYRLVTN